MLAVVREEDIDIDDIDFVSDQNVETEVGRVRTKHCNSLYYYHYILMTLPLHYRFISILFYIMLS